MLVYLYICIFLLIVVTVCFIWYVATRSSPIKNYKGKFPSGKIIQLENKSLLNYFTYITITDSLHNQYDVDTTTLSTHKQIIIWDDTNPIQLKLPTIPINGYLVIQAGNTNQEQNEVLYSIGLHMTLFHDSTGHIVYLYGGDTDERDILVTVPSHIKNSIYPIHVTKHSNINIPPNTTKWPSVINIEHKECLITNVFIQNSDGDIYNDTINQRTYHPHELNSVISDSPIYTYGSNNIIRIQSKSIDNDDYIHLFLYVNKDCYCITFYNDHGHIMTIVSNSVSDIKLTITCENPSNATLYKNTGIPISNNFEPAPISPIIAYSSIASRQQWNENYGYCGETSFITAAMYYGMYMSQWTIRELINQMTSNDTVDQTTQSSQLLLVNSDGNNNMSNALNIFQFSYTIYDQSSSFTDWITKQSNNGINPVIIGVYENNVLGGLDPTYDHIVPVVNSTSTTISFSDNGLYGDDGATKDPKNQNPDWTGKWDPSYKITDPTFNNPFLFTYNIPDCVNNRSNATNSSFIYSIPTNNNYGIAITGITGSTVRVQVVPSVQETDTFTCNNTDSCGVIPSSIKMSLTVYLYNLTVGVTYNVYCYSNYQDLQNATTQGFNTYGTNSNITRYTFTADSIKSTYIDPHITNSQQIALYRCIKSTDP